MNEQGSKCHNGIFSWGVRQSPALGRIYRLAQHAAQVWPVIPFRALEPLIRQLGTHVTLNVVVRCALLRLDEQGAISLGRAL